MDELDARLHRIGQHHFRAKFRLRGRDRAVVDLRGIATVRRHAEELVERRLAPAEPRNDGRQTPYRGHPVFVAQHATATCCRTCLARWHDIPAGRALDDAERGYVVEAICRWIVGQYAPPRRRPGRAARRPRSQDAARSQLDHGHDALTWGDIDGRRRSVVTRSWACREEVATVPPRLLISERCRVWAKPAGSWLLVQSLRSRWSRRSCSSVPPGPRSSWERPVSVQPWR
jgi:hypothetical protein